MASRYVCLMLPVLFVILLVSSTGTGCEGQGKADVPCAVIFSNKVADGTREMEILMDEADFNEDNLRKLANYYFQKYSEPDSIYAFVASDISQIEVFESHVGIANASGREQPSATFIRRGGKRLFKYKMPGAPMKTVVLNGDKPGNASAP